MYFSFLPARKGRWDHSTSRLWQHQVSVPQLPSFCLSSPIVHEFKDLILLIGLLLLSFVITPQFKKKYGARICKSRISLVQITSCPLAASYEILCFSRGGLQLSVSFPCWKCTYMSNISLELWKKTKNIFAMTGKYIYLYKWSRKIEITSASSYIPWLCTKHCILRPWSWEKRWFSSKVSATVNHNCVWQYEVPGSANKVSVPFSCIRWKREIALFVTNLGTVGK